jgi:hypothetical protein
MPTGLEAVERSKQKENQMNTYRGVYYFPTFEAARDYAIANNWPVARIISYQRGWAIQIRISGPYVGPNEANGVL